MRLQCASPNQANMYVENAGWAEWSSQISKTLLGMTDPKKGEGRTGFICGAANLLFLLSGCRDLPIVMGNIVSTISRNPDDPRYERAMNMDIHGLVKTMIALNFPKGKQVNASSIGTIYCGRIQNFIYDLSAHVMATFSGIVGVYQLKMVRRATRLVARVCDAFKYLLPPHAEWMPSWTGWHALAYVMEVTTGTVLSRNHKDLGKLQVIVFFDELLSNALRERGDNTLDLGNLKTTFGWCACSDQYMLVTDLVLENPKFAMMLPNIAAFKSAVKFSLDLSERLSCPATPTRDEDEDVFSKCKDLGTQTGVKRLRMS